MMRKKRSSAGATFNAQSRTVVASTEARAARVYKDRIVEAASDGTMVTRCYSGKPMRVLRNLYAEEWERKADEILPFPDQLITSLKAGVVDFAEDGTANADRTMMPAGQGAGGIDDLLPVAGIMERFLNEAREVIGRMGKLV